MKRIVTVIVFSLGAIFFIYLILRLIWSFEEKKVLNVYILDKTVTSFDRFEHRAFTWLLTNNRYILPNKKSYSHTKDYYGFFPVNISDEVFDFKSIRINEVDAYAAVFDMAYYTDCYGVHSFEWYKGKTKPVRSQKVYGGLNQNDYLLMKKMIDYGKLVIAEYNMFSTPTNALVRSKTEALLDITWTGWLGKYFQTLNVDNSHGPPDWMKNLYESQHMGAWPANKDGIVLLSNDGLIELLIEREHLNSSIPVIVTHSDESKRYGVVERALFEQWFEFIVPGQNHVVSNFELDVNDKGDEILAKLGLSALVPAVIRHSEKMPNYYYFCGDFAENPVQMWTAKVAGGRSINSFLYQFGAKNRAIFFRRYYTPLMNTVLEEYYSSLNKD